MINKEYKPLTTGGYANPKMLIQYRDRLCYLEDCIENGTLVFLPCKIGDKVWFVNKYRTMKQIESYTVDAIQIKSDKIMLEVHITECPDKYGIIPGYTFGQDVFRTKEAAEKALEEMKKC